MHVILVQGTGKRINTLAAFQQKYWVFKGMLIEIGDTPGPMPGDSAERKNYIYKGTSIAGTQEAILLSLRKHGVFEPTSQKELNKRIDQSESDFRNNHFKSSSELLAKYE